MPDSVASSFLSRTFGSKSSSGKEYKCTIQLLDDAETLNFDFKKSDTGQALLDHVCETLNLVEKDYFGLRFMDNAKHRYWLDPNKPIMKQIKGHSPIVFRFRVKYYPADPSILKEEITRYQLFLQLRRDLLHGRLYCPQNDAAKLGAYMMQSEIGDYNIEEHGDGYVSEYKLFLKQSAKLEEKISEQHKLLMGMNPAEADSEFLKRAATLDTYGFDPYTVKDAKLGQVYAGVSSQGFLVYHSNRKVHHVKWNDVEKVDYLGKDFFVYPIASYFDNELSHSDQSFAAPVFGRISPGPENESPIQEEQAENAVKTIEKTTNEWNTTKDDSGEPEKNAETPENHKIDHYKKKSAVRCLKYQCPSATFCKHLWKFTLAQKAFFTSTKSADVKPVTSKRRIPVFQRGSTFRFAGRVLQEIKEQEAPEREEPSFIRHHVERQPGREDRGFPWMTKYSTLPRSGPRTNDIIKEVKETTIETTFQSKEAPELTTTTVSQRLETTADLSPTCDLSPRDVSESDQIHSLITNAPNYNSQMGANLASLNSSSNSQSPDCVPVPISNSTPLKSANRGIRDNDVLSEDTKRANGLADTKRGEPDSGSNLQGAASAGKKSGGICVKFVKHLLTGLLFGIILVCVVVAVFEVRDQQFKGYVHAVPGLEQFRNVYYNPTRHYVLNAYQQALVTRSGKKGVWFGI